MSDQGTEITEPNIVGLYRVAAERGESIGGQSGADICLVAENRAAALQSYINTLQTQLREAELEIADLTTTRDTLFEKLADGGRGKADEEHG